MYYKISRYCYKLSKKLKNFSDKSNVIKEIEESMIKYVTDLIAVGMSPEMAEKKSIKNMGNTFFLAHKLNKANKMGIEPKINYYESEKIKPVVTYPGYGEWLEVYETRGGSLKPKHLFLNLKNTNMERFGLGAVDMIKYGLAAIIIIFVFGNFFVINGKRKFYKSSDIYDFGKLYNVTQIEEMQNDNLREYVYSMKRISKEQINDYISKIKENGYVEKDDNSFINEKGTNIKLIIEDEKLIVTIIEEK